MFLKSTIKNLKNGLGKSWICDKTHSLTLLLDLSTLENTGHLTHTHTHHTHTSHICKHIHTHKHPHPHKHSIKLAQNKRTSQLIAALRIGLSLTPGKYLLEKGLVTAISTLLTGGPFVWRLWRRQFWRWHRTVRQSLVLLAQVAHLHGNHPVVPRLHKFTSGKS